MICEIGLPADGVQYVYRFDRGANNFVVYCRLLGQTGDWVIRARKLDRWILAGADNRSLKLKEYLPDMTTLGHFDLQLRVRPKQNSRTATLKVRMGHVKIPPPTYASPWVRKMRQKPIAMNVIEVPETDTPQSIEPIRLLLLISLPFGR